MHIDEMFEEGQNRFCHRFGFEQPYGISKAELYEELIPYVRNDETTQVLDMVLGWWFPSRLRTQRMKTAFITSSMEQKERAYSFNMYLMDKWEGRTDEYL